jgi:hypothetical protein
MMSNAMRLGIGCATNEGISWSSYTNTFVAPIVAWLSNNPTLRPQYVILFFYTQFVGDPFVCK